MAIFLLDTSVIIDTLNKKRDRNEFLRQLVTQGSTLACCPINITEVYAGMRPTEEAKTKNY
jgi:predicted nucleic acid-binding protein